MGMNLGLESLQTEESTMSFEELMVDVMDTEQKFSEEQAIFDSIDRLEFIKDYVSEHGVSDTISAMIGDQISYSSAEELVEKIDVAIEGLLSKITGDTLDNTLKQIKEFADFFTKPHNGRVIASSSMKVKFVDLNDTTPMAAFCKGVGETIPELIRSLTGKGKTSEENLDKYFDALKGYMTTGNTILRNMKPVTMGYEEYKKAYEEMSKAAREVKSKFKMLEMAKIIAPKASTADIVNKLVKHGASEDKEGKQTLKVLNKPAINAKANSLIRGLLRIIRIVLAKGYAMVKQIDKDLNSKNRGESGKYDPNADYSKTTTETVKTV